MTDNRRNDEDLTQADRIVEELYRRTKEPIPWDESDDAILRLAREAAADRSSGAAAGDAGAAVGSGAGAADAVDDNVVPFDSRRRSFVHRVIHSPAIGFSLAASVMIGIFAGQGLTPYVDLGVAPGYRDVLNENERLQSELVENRALLTRSLGSKGTAGATAGLTEFAKVLGKFDCSYLSATMTAGARIVVSGYVSSAEDLKQLNARIAPFARTVSVVNDAQVRGWPFCKALQVLHEVGGAGSGPDRLPVVRPHEHGARYLKDERLVVRAEGTALYDGYLYVDFIQHDGKVLHMLHDGKMLGRKVGSGQSILLGAGTETYSITAPYGTEMLVAVSTPVPLFEKSRPRMEDARRYLEALQNALVRVNSTNASRPAVSSFQFITTEAK